MVSIPGRNSTRSINKLKFKSTPLAVRSLLRPCTARGTPTQNSTQNRLHTCAHLFCLQLLLSRGRRTARWTHLWGRDRIALVGLRQLNLEDHEGISPPWHPLRYVMLIDKTFHPRKPLRGVRIIMKSWMWNVCINEWLQNNLRCKFYVHFTATIASKMFKHSLHFITIHPEKSNLHCWSLIMGRIRGTGDKPTGRNRTLTMS